MNGDARPFLRLVLWSAVLGALLVSASRRVGPLPPLGPLFDPVHGIWSVARSAELPDSFAASIPGLGGEVRVAYDDRRVPHVFASTTSDAYRALGYVVARDRLFQMEMQTRATAGTLSEVAGEALLEIDVQVRRLGLARAAERDFARLAEQDPEVAEALVAYADGVNAFIGSLSPEEKPFEYHLLGATPAPWEPVHTFYLLKRMGWILAFSPVELLKERVAARVGREAADALFPADAPIQEPIAPHEGARWVGGRIPAPQLPGPGRAAAPSRHLGGLGPAPVGVGSAAGLDRASRINVAADLGRSSSIGVPAVPWAYHHGARSSALGSNNWAVGPSRSESGNPILAGDPHLSLSLPSIWYEAHLVVPGDVDVYGVTLAGVPGIVIGFNRDVAWSFTNTGADVMDYYRERVDDPGDPTRHYLDGAWELLDVRVERFRGPDGQLLATDTVRNTHRGPLLAIDGEPMSLRWTVLEGQTELGSLMRVARARSVDEWLDAMDPWHAPAQNGLVAGRDGSIAIRSFGWFPQRPAGVRGDMVHDGTTRATDWLGRAACCPPVRDPTQGYLASANQQPYDPEVEPSYLGADWPDPWRALTINELLGDQERHDATDMEAYQTHPTSVRARSFRTSILAIAAQVAERDGLSPEAAVAVGLLEDWDGRYHPGNQRAVLFEATIEILEDALWDELADADDRVSATGARVAADSAWVAPDSAATGESGRDATPRERVATPREREATPRDRVATPREQVLWSLLDQPDSPWWDDQATPETEDRDAIVVWALEAAAIVTGATTRDRAAVAERVRSEPGAPSGGGWAWRSLGRHNIHHLLRLPALSRLDLATGGAPGLLNPMTGTGTHGASWRMVVELGDQVAGRGTYPGGQSGNPASREYDDRVAHWVAGELEDLRFPRTESELRTAGRTRAQLVLIPARASRQPGGPAAERPASRTDAKPPPSSDSSP